MGGRASKGNDECMVSADYEQPLICWAEEKLSVKEHFYYKIIIIFA